MNSKKIQVVYFSPSGTTEKITKAISGGLAGEKVFHNLLENRVEKKIIQNSDDALILVMPVFGGRIPNVCLPSIKHLHGNNTPAIIVAVYGNREYDDALLEMQDLLESLGYSVVAAGAFIAQHSIFTDVAANRPDQSDMEKIEDFAKQCQNKLDTYKDTEFIKLELKGNRPYKTYMTPGMHPTGDSKCTNCRTCVKICPVDAISGDAPKKTKKDKCIMCTACIAHCPAKARSFSGPKFVLATKKFNSNCSKRKEPEIYI